MPDNIEKERRKKIMEELRQKADEEFELSLPADRSIFKNLFDYLDEQLEEHGCDNTLKLTAKFLSDNKFTNADTVMNWLGGHSGYCDCEVLANVEQLFED
jgi:Protein of unknown function (DUF2695)